VKISLVIPVINEAGQLPQTIRRAWECGADEVVRVDGGSADGSLEIARQSECRLVRSSTGRAVQMNRGARESSGDALVFLHADNWLAVGACAQIRSALSDCQNQFGAFSQQIESPRGVYRWIESGNRWRVKWQGLIYGDQALFIRRNVFDQVGGFPEIELMEDFALSQKLKSVGTPVLLPGPTFVCPRRWEKSGPVRQTIRNWMIATGYRLGVSPNWLAKRYRRHDK
jgi:rSAM/selenodomain-associated transferase 2